MLEPGRSYPPPNKRDRPARTEPRPPLAETTAGRWTGTLPDKFIATLVDLVSLTRLHSSVATLAAFPTRHTFSPHIGPVATLLAAQFGGFGYTDVVQRPWTRSGHSAVNVVCTKPGSGPAGPMIIVCAHFDSRMSALGDAVARAPGADDNGSGVAALLELARILAPVTLTATLQFVAFSGEEQGLWGSAAYAAELAAASTHVHRVVNLDMVGWKPPDGSVVVERDLGNAVPGNDAASRDFGAVMAQAGADYSAVPVRLGPIFASDYMPFEAQGYVAIGAYEGDGNPHYHQSSDSPDTLDYPYLTDVTRMTLATLLTVALPVRQEPAPLVDLFVRDSLADTGAQPSPVPHWTSPDIWVRNDPPPADDPEQGHQNPLLAVPNYLYVRVRNRGSASLPAGAATLRAYHCDPGTGMVWPRHFTGLGQLTVTEAVPAGGAVRVGPFVWTPRVADHECLLAVVSTPQDLAVPDVYPGELNHGLLVRYDNNVGQRNVSPQLAVPGGTVSVALTLRGGVDATRNAVQLDASALPADTVITLRVPSRLIEASAALIGFRVAERTARWTRLTLPGGRVGRMGDFALTADARAALTLTVDFGALAEHLRRYPLVFSQSQQGQPAGKLTVDITAVIEAEDFVFGNRRSRELHRADCAFRAQMNPRNTVPFQRRTDALARGYNDCAHCLPGA